MNIMSNMVKVDNLRCLLLNILQIVGLSLNLPYLRREQTRVLKRWNLMDIVRLMMRQSELTQFLWGENLKTIMYIQNRVLSKHVPKLHLNILKVGNLALSIFMWGCATKVKIYDPTTSKLSPITFRCYFFIIPSNAKGYNFYWHTCGTKIVNKITTNF